MAWTGETPTSLFHYTEAEHAEEGVGQLIPVEQILLAVGRWEEDQWQVEPCE